MRFLSFTALILIRACSASDGHYETDDGLARALANVGERDQAVAAVVASGYTRVPLLLSWTTKPPVGIDNYQLKIGLADVFGRMKTKEAIPFLIKNISIDRMYAVNTWIKSAEVVEQRLAAAAALIRIGPAVAEPVIRAWSGLTDHRDRLATIFVVSNLRGVPGTRNFLLSVLGEANLQRAWAEEGLARLAAAR